MGTISKHNKLVKSTKQFSVDGDSKKESKRRAAFAVLIQVFRSAGIDDPKWDSAFE